VKFKTTVAALAIGATLLAGGCSSKEAAETQKPETDVVTTASIVNENEAFLNAISKDGTWIIATLNDLSFDKELVIEGEFRNKGDDTKEIYRKLALYAQDEDHNVTERYTLTAPKLTIKSENTRIQGGTFVGDVYVEANGFTIKDAKVEGNVYFANEDVKSTFTMGEDGSVTGATEVQK